MKLARDVKTAHSISVVGCDFKNCNCGAVYVRLHDDMGEIFAVGVVSPEIAIEFSDDIASEVERMRSEGKPKCRNASGRIEVRP
jgi:hypothetical protein